MDYEIVPVAMEHVPGFNAALDYVAREGKYLSMNEGPPLESTAAFVRNIIAGGQVQLMVVSGGAVVGWCDILPLGTRPSISHIGVLGMGLLPAFRGRGIGRALLTTALEKARAQGILRVELSVLEGNDAAMALYRKCGFETEGFSKKAQRDSDGSFRGVYTMSLIF